MALSHASCVRDTTTAVHEVTVARRCLVIDYHARRGLLHISSHLYFSCHVHFSHSCNAICTMPSARPPCSCPRPPCSCTMYHHHVPCSCSCHSCTHVQRYLKNSWPAGDQKAITQPIDRQINSMVYVRMQMKM